MPNKKQPKYRVIRVRWESVGEDFPAVLSPCGSKVALFQSEASALRAAKKLQGVEDGRIPTPIWNDLNDYTRVKGVETSYD